MCYSPGAIHGDAVPQAKLPIHTDGDGFAGRYLMVSMTLCLASIPKLCRLHRPMQHAPIAHIISLACMAMHVEITAITNNKHQIQWLGAGTSYVSHLIHLNV